MKKVNLILGFLVGLIFFSCSSDATLLAQNKYKGTPKHQQSSIDIFPKATEYTFDQGLESSLANKLNRKIDELIEQHNVAGVTATILIPEKGVWETTKGFISKPDNIIADSLSVFYWGSVGKLITSTIIQELVIEGKLSLDDRLSKWFPDFQYSKKITIEQLLTHTNGIYSFNVTNEYYSPNELLEISKAHKNLFKPGEYWSYTNTGYLLLALKIEELDSKTFEQVVKERIADPLHLKTLRVIPKEPPSNLALAHDKDAVIDEVYSVALGAGNIISNSKDMAVFLSALLTEKLIPKETVHNMMTDLYPMFDDKGEYYGEGIMLYDFNEINNANIVWIGHSGGTQNYRAELLFDINSKVIMAISINENIPTESVALRLTEIINE